MKHHHEVAVLIAAWNEEGIIAKTLHSIAMQQLDKKYQFDIHVIANGCSDNTVAVAQQAIAEMPQHAQMKFTVHTKKEAHKIKALNFGLRHTTAPLIFAIDADSVLSSNCFAETLALFEDPTVMVGGPMPQLVVSRKNCNLLIGQIQKTANICNRLFECMTPAGCMIGFRRGFIKRYPTSIAAEDTWLSFYAAYKYGWEAVAITRKAKVNIVAPQHWADYIKQESRFARGTQQLLEVFPEFKAVRADQIRQVKRRATRHLETLKKQLKKERLRVACLRYRRVVQQICEENAEQIASQLLTANGRWDPIVTTKRSVPDEC